ncbi:MAG: hypothetical protein HPY60_09705 [Candidatus Methanofastidiosum sp.]|nr:hypothetical protein [Methanofastidiosum sp.]NYT14040.1 hypothetical protein [Candidatus Methanofastidiosa archaeon]
MAEEARWKKYSRRWEKKARDYKQKKDELESKFNSISQENENLKKELISTREERDKVKESYKEVEKKGEFGTVAIAVILILGILFAGSVAGLAFLYNSNLALTSANSDLTVEVSSLKGQISKLQYEKSLLESEKSGYQIEITDIEKELEKVKGDSDATIRLLQREVLSLTSKVSRLESDINAKEVTIASLQNQLAECEYRNRCFTVSITPTSRTGTTGADQSLSYTMYVNFSGYGCGRRIEIPITLNYDFNTSGTNTDTFGLQASSGNWCCN